jgi:hypothetical protein
MTLGAARNVLVSEGWINVRDHLRGGVGGVLPRRHP